MPRPPAAARVSSLVQPVAPGRYMPTAARPVRAKARTLDPDTEILPHSHPWAQVAIAASGVARITAGHSTYLVPAWRAVWIPPDVEHVVTVVEAAELRTLYIHQDPQHVGPGVPPAACGPWRQCRVMEVSALLRELVLQMDVEMDGPGAPDAALLARERRLGELALDELRRAAPVRLGIALPQEKRLRTLCEAVLADPTRHDTLADWAAAIGASTRTVARLFRQELGTSFSPWRQQVLLARALTLVAQGRPMALIAADLGYTSASAFTAMVRRSVGAPPGRFFGNGGIQATGATRRYPGRAPGGAGAAP